MVVQRGIARLKFYSLFKEVGRQLIPAQPVIGPAEAVRDEARIRIIGQRRPDQVQPLLQIDPPVDIGIAR